MHFEFARSSTFLSVHFVLEVDEELLQLVNRVTVSDVRYQERSLEDGRHVALHFDLLDAFGDHLSDLRAHDLGNFAPVAPEDVCDSFLTQLSVDAHVEFEMLVHQQCQESALTSCQMSVVLRALVEDDVGELRLDLFHPGQVILGEG